MRKVCHFLRSFDSNNAFPDNDTATALGTQDIAPSAVVPQAAVKPPPVVANSPIGQAATFPASDAVVAANINVTQAPATPNPFVLITQVSGSDRWYCVSVGRQVVFDSWCVSHGISPPPYSPNHRSSVSPHVVGVSGACYSRFNSQAEAENSYRTAFNNWAVCIVNSF